VLHFRSLRLHTGLFAITAFLQSLGLEDLCTLELYIAVNTGRNRLEIGIRIIHYALYNGLWIRGRCAV
jgi:hypothetical protein